MSDKTNTRIITQFITTVWNENHLDALETLLDPGYYDYSYEPRNREGLVQTLRLMQSAFPGHKTSIEEIVEEGDTVAVCLTLRGIQSGPFRDLPASGKTFEIGGYRFFKVRDGKIVSHRGLLDLPALLQQIGTGNQ
jgi:steroid delta-isomerase-like uncharacterized protein